MRYADPSVDGGERYNRHERRYNMAGQRIDREERYEKTGLTTQARKELVAGLRKQGWTERRIAKHLGVAPSNVHYILAELAGKPRIQARTEMCENCGENFPAKELDPNSGYCQECQAA